MPAQTLGNIAQVLSLMHQPGIAASVAEIIVLDMIA